MIYTHLICMFHPSLIKLAEKWYWIWLCVWGNLIFRCLYCFRKSQTPPKTSVAFTGSVQPEEPAFMKPPKKQENQAEHICVASSSSAVQKANEMLQDLGRLKNEMRSLLQVRASEINANFHTLIVLLWV